MAKKPTTWHGKALAAFTTGRITRHEYIDCLNGKAMILGGSIQFLQRRLVDGRMAWGRRLVSPCSKGGADG